MYFANLSNFLRVFPCTIIFLKANIFLFSASQNWCSFWTAILFFATRRIWADIQRVIQPIRLQNSSFTVNDYIIIKDIRRRASLSRTQTNKQIHWSLILFYACLSNQAIIRNSILSLLPFCWCYWFSTTVSALIS